MSITIPQPRATGDIITATYYNEIIAALEHLLNLTADGVPLAEIGAGKAIGWDIGDLKISARISDIGKHFLRCDGRTIGNPNSNATARANADMLALYTHLWEQFTDATLPIFDSGGTETTRGTSALVDFNADKRLSLPDLRGRVVAGRDGDAQRIAQTWADVLGGTGGSEKHTLTVDELPMHTHLPSPGNNFVIGVTGGGSFGLGVGSNVNITATTAATGSNLPHNSVQPTIVFNYFIYTGL